MEQNNQRYATLVAAVEQLTADYEAWEIADELVRKTKEEGSKRLPHEKWRALIDRVVSIHDKRIAQMELFLKLQVLILFLVALAITAKVLLLPGYYVLGPVRFKIGSSTPTQEELEYQNTVGTSGVQVMSVFTPTLDASGSGLMFYSETKEDGINPSETAVIEYLIAHADGHLTSWKSIASVCHYESGGFKQWRSEGVPYKSATNSNGTYDVGLCKINSIHGVEGPISNSWVANLEYAWKYLDGCYNRTGNDRSAWACYNGNWQPYGTYSNRVQEHYNSKFWEDDLVRISKAQREASISPVGFEMIEEGATDVIRVTQQGLEYLRARLQAGGGLGFDVPVVVEVEVEGEVKQFAINADQTSTTSSVELPTDGVYTFQTYNDANCVWNLQVAQKSNPSWRINSGETHSFNEDMDDGHSFGVVPSDPNSMKMAFGQPGGCMCDAGTMFRYVGTQAGLTAAVDDSSHYAVAGVPREFWMTIWNTGNRASLAEKDLFFTNDTKDDIVIHWIIEQNDGGNFVKMWVEKIPLLSGQIPVDGSQ